MRLSKIISDDAWCFARHLPSVLHSFLSAATSSLQVNSSQQEELYILASLPRWFSFSKYLGTQFALGSRRSKEAKHLRPKWSIFAWKHLHEETPISSWAQSVGVSLAASCFVCLNDCKFQSPALPMLFWFLPVEKTPCYCWLLWTCQFRSSSHLILFLVRN